jgi:hypothetical protein
MLPTERFYGSGILFRFLVSCLLSVSIWAFFKWFDRYLTHKKQELLMRNAKFELSAPILLLRSFLDSPLVRNVPTRIHFLKRRSFWSSGDRFVKSVELSLSQLGRPIAIGITKKERPDLGWHELLIIASSEQTWWGKFQVAANLSRIIYVVPELSEGLLQEVRYLIKEDLQYKLLIYMPPTPKGYRAPRLANRWALVRSEWQKAGFQLPVYESRGMLFIPDSKMSLVHAKRFREIGAEMEIPSRILEATIQLLPMIRSNGGTVSDIVLQIDKQGCGG